LASRSWIAFALTSIFPSARIAARTSFPRLRVKVSFQPSPAFSRAEFLVRELGSGQSLFPGPDSLVVFIARTFFLPVFYSIFCGTTRFVLGSSPAANSPSHQLLVKLAALSVNVSAVELTVAASQNLFFQQQFLFLLKVSGCRSFCRLGVELLEPDCCSVLGSTDPNRVSCCSTLVFPCPRASASQRQQFSGSGPRWFTRQVPSWFC
jgi:hypothetical protein